MEIIMFKSVPNLKMINIKAYKVWKIQNKAINTYIVDVGYTGRFAEWSTTCRKKLFDGNLL